MTTARETRETNAGEDGPLMPEPASLYVGGEAVAVGVCEGLRPDDYITSTHRALRTKNE